VIGAGLKIITESTASEYSTGWGDPNVETMAIRWQDIGPIPNIKDVVEPATSWIGINTIPVCTYQAAGDPRWSALTAVKEAIQAQVDLMHGLHSKVTMDPRLIVMDTGVLCDYRPTSSLTFVREKTGGTAHQKIVRLPTPSHAPDPLASYGQYAKSNWDGDGAEAITPETLAYARRILSLLPNTFGAPDIAPAADGSIALEWVPDSHAKLDKLFLDIGPGEEWRAYWLLRDETYGRLPSKGYTSNTKRILQKLFDDLHR
jgi:hypothetical protein